jgi:hypothetical protein
MKTLKEVLGLSLEVVFIIFIYLHFEKLVSWPYLMEDDVVTVLHGLVLQRGTCARKTCSPIYQYWEVVKSVKGGVCGPLLGH